MTLPLPRTCPYAPPAEYERLREEDSPTRVTLPTGATAWAVSRHQDVRAVLSDTRFSSNRTAPGFPTLIKGSEELTTTFRPSMIGMDPPEHGPARRAALGEFTVRRMRALQPRIQQIVDERLDAMLAGPRPADLVRSLSLPVPSLVICEQLGVPYTDHEFFQLHSSVLISRVRSVEEKRHALTELQTYLGNLIADKEREPADDLLGRQILKHREAGTYDRDDLTGLAFLLLIAGHETTANMISLGTLALLERPEEMAALRSDPTRTPAAVEEFLRLFTIVDTVPSRAATVDVELGGVLIRKGEGVLVLSNAGNHDPAVYPRPDELDIGRGARNHVAFGFGPHQCLGQNLARLELQVVFDTLLRRVPGLKLAAPVEKLPFKDDSSVYGLHELPVSW
ncbi:cytochrome P450 [Streptomyces corynorhini]|uniref:Cytochrome P450 n=2 Tax=Streptomyces corynorhini TaxID=2282652 RepID=A0A370B1I2_9ACTN|nr:cytochrome P450 [Streptomyces corynorhini]